jgi:hypothetical protein
MANRVATMGVANMDKRGTQRVLLAAAVAGALALSGCGSGGTKTVSISSAAPPATTSQSTTTARTTPSSPTSTTPTNTGTSTTGQGSAEATHTTTAPAFTKQANSPEGLGAAVAVVKAHGFTAEDTSAYHPEQTLRVLVGTRDGTAQQAFFFVGGHYIGTDTKEPSAAVKVSGQSDTEVTLSYPLYKAGEPTGGQATVHFQLNNGRLVPLNPIPPASAR